MQLFVSYAHEDTKAVRELVDVLTAGGHVVWFDDYILPGQDWKVELDQKISASEAFVYVLTGLSLGSEWCQWEFAAAARFQKAIIPVLMEPALAIPASLNTLQYADFTNGVTAIATAKLMGALHSSQKISAANAPAAPAAPRGVPSRAWENAKHWTDRLVPAHYQPQNSVEEVVGKFGANLLRDHGFTGGRIILTTQRLLFESDAISRQREPLSISLKEICGVRKADTLGLIPNSIIVQCSSGQEYQFVVFNRSEIIELIKQLAGIVG